ncbi:GDSL-type esterase/lipase family protein [Amycolatopsis rubida]|uniref:GDSL-type esterase/lipase family protein n=1 Tax=Amycolatopsis rubida TaxID=112413 RepID=UPI0018E3A89F
MLGTSADTGYGRHGLPVRHRHLRADHVRLDHKIANDLHAEWNTTTKNYAHNGAMAADYLPGGRWPDTAGALADLTQRQPDLVLIDLGGNELISQTDPAVFKANLGKVIDTVRAARPGVDILLPIYAELKWTPNPWAARRRSTSGRSTPRRFTRRRSPRGSANLPNPSPWLAGNVHLNDAGNLAEYGMWWGWTSSLGSIC